MCGIFGYTGNRNAASIAIEGLKKLEYRGYDSAGIALLHDGTLAITKRKGKVAELEAVLGQMEARVSIAHTRWATHGEPSERNAHPHTDSARRLALVHNGIIENYKELRNSLESEGVAFVSETDTEVIVQLIAKYDEGDLLKALQVVLEKLEGSFAMALLHIRYPDQIFAAVRHSPLAIGLGEGESFLSSDARAFASYTRNALYLSDGELAIISPGKIELFSSSLARVERPIVRLPHDPAESNKGDYTHYTLKEICEQPQALRQAIHCRYLMDYGTAYFEELQDFVGELSSAQRILIVACGTSWHAGYLGSYLLENLARIPTQVEIASEFRYKNPIVPPGTLTIAISQSGETADTIAAVREIKAKGHNVLALCNVEGSTLVREANSSIFLRAGQEIGVCSTKAFTSQFIILALLGLQMARMRHLSRTEGQEFLNALNELPEQVTAVIAQSPRIASLAVKYAHFDNFFFVGRSYMYPTCLEAALKLKEISYINANAYPAGEMKHGPIALIGENCPTMAFCCHHQTFEKLVSNLMEIKARRGPIIAIAQEECSRLEGIVDDLIVVPRTRDELAAIPASVAAQLFAYYVALERGVDIDHPRNLAKSVTVE